jgi:adenylosuccinate lyase
MQLSPLLAISPVDGRYHDKVDHLRPIFSEYALIKWRLTIEVHWLIALSEQEAITEIQPFSSQTHAQLLQLIDKFDENDAQTIKDIEKVTNHDVKAVEYYLKNSLKAIGNLDSYYEFVHFACTSEDINNLAYAMMLKHARDDILLPQLHHLQKWFVKMAHDYASVAMLARTHGQPATPTTLGKEMANIAARLQRQIDHYAKVSILGKFNGAVGNFNAHLTGYPDLNWNDISRQFIQSFGLEFNAYTTQIEPHDWIADYSHALERINTILTDASRDFWSYISIDYFKQKKLETEVGSSTMPHKVNPIDFENAEGNLGIANALLAYFAMRLPVSRWQRDLTDSTLLRNIGVALAHSLIAYQSLAKGLAKLTINEDKLHQDLDDNWAVLAEAYQTVMRRHGIENSYEKLKAATRGEKVSKANLHALVQSLPLTEHVKQQLLALTPASYLGAAVRLAQQAS